MQPTALDKVEELGLNWDYSKQHGLKEIDVVVDDVEYKNGNHPEMCGIWEDPDQQLVDYYLLNWDEVNCVEAINFCAI